MQEQLERADTREVPLGHGVVLEEAEEVASPLVRDALLEREARGELGVEVLAATLFPTEVVELEDEAGRGGGRG